MVSIGFFIFLAAGEPFLWTSLNHGVPGTLMYCYLEQLTGSQPVHVSVVVAECPMSPTKSVGPWQINKYAEMIVITGIFVRCSQGEYQ